MATNRKQLATWLPQQTAERVEAHAERRGRSVSNYIAIALQEKMDVDERVYGPPESNTRVTAQAA